MKTFIQNKLTRAFTMIELVFVIVVVGIISAMIAPSFSGNNARQAADQLVSHIRYAQHLAMMDNKFETSNQNWYKNRWNIDLNTTSYTISYEQYKNDGSNAGTKYASNPIDPGKFLNPTDTKALNLSDEYGVTITNNCSTNKIFFDYIGRPFNDTTNPATAPYQNLLQANCTIVLSDGDVANDITVDLYRETGYVRTRIQ